MKRNNRVYHFLESIIAQQDPHLGLIILLVQVKLGPQAKRIQVELFDDALSILKVAVQVRVDSGEARLQIHAPSCIVLQV